MYFYTQQKNLFLKNVLVRKLRDRRQILLLTLSKYNGINYVQFSL